MEYRIRDIKIDLDVRDNHKIGGYINVTERESETLYDKKRGVWFKEVMKRGAFRNALNEALKVEQRDIPLLLEHNYDKQIATTANGSFTLEEDQIGLKFEAIVSDENLLKEVRDRKITSCSFGFIPNDQEIQEVNSRLEKRFVENLTLYECSLVKNPAYVGSLVEERALQEALEADKEAEEIRKKMENQSDDKDKDLETDKNSKSSEKDESKKDKKEEDNEKCEKNESAQEDANEEDFEENERGCKDKKDTRECQTKEDSKEKREMDVDTQGSLTIDKEEIRQIVREVISESEEKAEQCDELADCQEESQKMYEECANNCADEALINRTKALRYKYKVLKLKKFEQSI